MLLPAAGALMVAPALALMPVSAMAASPFPTPATADQLACDLSPAGDPTDYSAWWTSVSQNSQLADWFWKDIMPNNAASSCRSDTANTFWTRAVPGNWAPVADIGDWPWASGGYFTQTLWLQAMPEGWAPVANLGGWPAATGGYFAQWFWLHAVPDNIVGVGNIGGWPWPSGGYYTQWLWLHAIPDNWATVDDIGGWPWASGGYYTQWFWLHAAPDDLADSSGGTATNGGYYQGWLWLHAVPENWASRGRVDDWPWTTGGYYTQWLWTHAIADEWAKVPGIAGAPWANAGYYKQWFWLHAVPDNWVGVGNVGGWPWPSGGYYTQWLWMHAVPDDWAFRSTLELGHGNNSVAGQGSYRHDLWESAIPDGWHPIGDIGGWGQASGGYYAQWFWLHAAPDQWARNSAMAIGGTTNAGYYDYTFYQFAAVRDFGWRDALSLNGSSGAGYYDVLFHGAMSQRMPHYAQLLTLAGGYLSGAQTIVPASTWYSPGTQAVVAFTFDTEGAESETCAVSSVLNRQGVTATFYLTGYTADGLTAKWRQCLAGFDIQDHTVDHPGDTDLAPRTFLDTLPNADQVHQIRDNVAHITARIPTAQVTSFRTPWCDSSKSFDGSVAQNAVVSGMKSDRSVAQVPAAAVEAGVVPSLGLSQFSLSAFPSPFTITTASGPLVEFPFTYPSDWTAQFYHDLNPRAAPPTAGDPAYAVSLWEKEFDEIYNQHGVMVVLMHPWIQAPNGQAPAGLDALITYMKTKPGVSFTTATTANQSFRTSARMAQ